MNGTLDFANVDWGRISNSNTDTQRKYLFRHAKGKSMVNFYIVNALGQNQIQILALFWDCCKMPKSVISCNLSKNGFVWAAQSPTFSELKIKFDPLLDRSWCQFFKIIKDHGPKNPPGVILGTFFPPPMGIFSKKISWVFCPSI